MGVSVPVNTKPEHHPERGGVNEADIRLKVYAFIRGGLTDVKANAPKRSKACREKSAEAIVGAGTMRAPTEGLNLLLSGEEEDCRWQG